MTDQKVENFVKKVQQLVSSGGYDLSLEEDLSMAIMNLVSLEEHFFFTAEKTGKEKYFDFLAEVREVRKSFMSRLVAETEGETWCVMKHLLAATMRFFEVGTKYQTDGKKDLARESFDAAFRIYNLFWAVRLGMVGEIKRNEAAWSVDDLTKKLVDCCKE